MDATLCNLLCYFVPFVLYNVNNTKRSLLLDSTGTSSFLVLLIFFWGVNENDATDCLTCVCVKNYQQLGTNYYHNNIIHLYTSII